MGLQRVLTSIARRRPAGAGRPGRAGGSGAVDALRDSWSRYPSDWKADPDLNLGADTLGEEWGGPAFADLIVDELVAPYVGPDVDILELGCGGGKFSQRLAPKCRSLVCADISPAMIEHARANLTERGIGGNVSYATLNGVDFDGVPDQSVDFIFSYDVQLHLQPQNVFSYMLDARRVLRENGVFMLHQVNLASEGGMTHFLIQYLRDTWKRDFDDARRRGHIYFMGEDQMRALANEAGLATERIVSEPTGPLTGGRDLIGFLTLKPSRLRALDPDSATLLQVSGQRTVYVVLDGRRAALMSARQFENAGFVWDRVRQVSEAELASIPEMEPMAPWE